EVELLELLDRAYFNSRHEIAFPIGKDQLDVLEQKQNCFLDEIKQFFKKELELLQSSIPNSEKISREVQETEVPELLDTIRQLGEDNFEMMRPANRWTKKGCYLNHVYI